MIFFENNNNNFFSFFGKGEGLDVVVSNFEILINSINNKMFMNSYSYISLNLFFNLIFSKTLCSIFPYNPREDLHESFVSQFLIK